MIRLKDSLTLALTKLRTRKVRLIITIVVSGLLFSVLMGASMVARGVFASVESFSSEGLGKRYIVSGTSTGSSDLWNNQPITDRAEALYKEQVAQKKAEAKRLGITYDQAADRSPIEEFDMPNGKQRNVNFTHPLGKKAVQEYLVTKPQDGLAAFKKLGNQYHANAYYSSKRFPYVTDGRLQVLKDGKETFDLSTQFGKDGPASALDSFTNEWTLMTSSLLQPFILPGENLGTDSKGNAPIIIPVSAAEQLLGLKALPGTAKTAQKLERTKEVRQKSKGITFAICYRNGTSASYVDSAVATQQEITQNKNNKNYKQPDLVYGIPTEPCGASPITRDVRPKEQKDLDAKQNQFEATFGKPAAEQSKIHFRVVGIVPDPSFQNAAGIGQIIGSLVSSSLGTGWYTPLEEAGKQPTLSKLFDDTTAAVNGTQPTNYAEFKTAAQAQTFIDKASCAPDFGTLEKMSSSAAIDMANPYKACIEAGKPFELRAFGSNSLALNDVKDKFSQIFRIAALVVAVIGAIIMMGTVGRMITDSRRETAVFRAIGAKRMDIAQIYLLYTLLLSLLIGIFAFIGGSLAAVVAQHKYAQDFTVEALVAYNASDLNRTFLLYKLDTMDILYLAALAIGTGLISVAIPLLRNVRRNPIRDMRDDT